MHSAPAALAEPNCGGGSEQSEGLSFEVLRLGSDAEPYVNAALSANFSRAVLGPIIEVKPFQQACETCDSCPCVGVDCGPRCECSCNAMCRLRREPSCSHTAGVLSPGRWFVAIDSPGPFTLQATLVAATAIVPSAAAARRTLFGTSAGRQAIAGTSSEGIAFSDYFYYDPAPHESLKLQVELLRVGAASGGLDVYVRFGEWPTTQLYDASMTTSPQATSVSPQFVLQAERLLNERIYVMVLAQGGSPVEYALSIDARANVPLLFVCGAMFLLGIGVLVLVVRRWLQRADYKDIP